MNNPPTIDRRDVAHPTNPLTSDTQIEQQDLGQPLDSDADKLPPGGQGAAIRGIPKGANPNDPGDDGLGGMPHDVPPARSGQASAEQGEAEVRAQTSNSGGANRIHPDTHIPTPVKQDPGFRRTSDQGER
jgi:hypothetical protein